MIFLIKKAIVSFCFGACVYPAMELVWRKRTHWTMSIAGGLCFSGIYSANKIKSPKHIRCCACAGIITSVEFIFGKIFNSKKQIWDYSNMPLNYKGQICAPYCALWLLLSYPALFAAYGMDKYIFKECA